MAGRSLKASEQGSKILKQALRRKGWTQDYLAGSVGCVRLTISSLVNGKKPHDRELFINVCESLGLNWEDIAESESPEPETDLVLDELVREVREKVHADIQKRCGEMRVLDMTRPIDLGTIYTDVNILQDISGRRRLDLEELLKQSRVEEFDRLGFAHAKRERRPGLEVVEEFDKLMLLGKPGAGKTTFLKRLATLCNAGEFQRHRVPIFISLKEFSDSSEKPELLPYIDRWFRHLEIRQPNTAEQILRRGCCFLLLDGLDEVSESNSGWILGEIRHFSGRFPDNAFVVSCRIAAKEFIFQSFTEVEVADFTDEQIADFATRWFEAKQLPDKPREFLAQLEKYPRIKELATNPLLLTLLCLVLEKRTNFPANRSELYKEGLDILLKKWDIAFAISREEAYRELSLKRKEDMLSQLAFTTFESGNYFFKQKEAESLIESYIENLPGARTDPEALRLDREAVLKSIEAQHGLLVERARGIYSFSHLTFHEYFTARYIEQDDKLYPVLISYITEKRWREVILLTVGMVRNADSVLLSMKSHIDGMLANDEKLQQYLNWVDRKARSVNAPYKPAALRAFYSILDLDSTLSIDLIPATFVLASLLDASIRLGLDSALKLDAYLYRILDLAPDFAPDRPLGLNLDLALGLGLDPHHNLARILEYNLILEDNLKYNRDSVFEPSIQELQISLPDPRKDKNHFRQWWQDNSSAWLSKLRAVMIEQRNIGHDWQFSEAQKELLQQYYNANIVLVDCLNSDCYVSRSVREEIEASLLLPMSEIQKQFPNQGNFPSSSPE